MPVTNNTQRGSECDGQEEEEREEHKQKEEAHTEEALWSSEQPQETAGRFLADGLQLLNSDRRISGKEPLWQYGCMVGWRRRRGREG